MSTILVVHSMALVGTGIGVLTGLTPGLHVNTMALLLLSASGSMYAMLGGGLGIAVIIATAATAHTFLDFIPSAFLGVPDDDTALTVLPAHNMVLEGRGFEATCLSSLGSALALLLAVGILVPFRYLFTDAGLYPVMRRNIVFILIGLCTLLVVTETGKGNRVRGMVSALVVLGISGAFGLVALEIGPMPVIDLPGNILFPVLSGVFGIPPLVASLNTGGSVPEQEIRTPDMPVGATTTSVATGSLSGAVLGFIPGMTSAHATVLSMVARGERSTEQVIVTLSSVNTANAFMSMMAIFIIGRGRSGAALAIQDTTTTPLWSEGPPTVMLHLIAAILLAGAIAFIVTLGMGLVAARTFSRIPYRAVTTAILISLVVLVFLFTGPIGLVVMMVGAVVGQVPVELGVRRSHAMGVLLIPVIIMLI